MNHNVMQRLKFYGGLLLGIALTLFAVSNLHATNMRFVFWSVKLPLIVMVLLSAATGAIWASLWITLARRRRELTTDLATAHNDALLPSAASRSESPMSTDSHL